MTVQEWLERICDTDKEIEILQSELQSFFDKLTGYSQSYADITASDSLLTAYSDYAKGIKRRVDELSRIKAEVLEVISAVEKDTYRQLLVLRYVEGMTWECIAEKMYYSVRGIQRTHKRALPEVEKILNERGIEL